MAMTLLDYLDGISYTASISREEDALDQEGHGGLAAGAGDAHQRQLLPRPAEVVPAKEGVGGPGVLENYFAAKKKLFAMADAAVVNLDDPKGEPPIWLWMVPMRPTRFPACSRMLLIRKATVVLPLVPVMPTSDS